MKILLDECVEELKLVGESFPWTDRQAYADWLAQTYYYVRHSTRLLASAAARFAYDEWGNALHHRFAAHMAEEKKHELLALHDMAAIGASIDRFPEHHATRMFYEPQYFKIEHQGPAVLLGYILVLEAMGPAHGRRVADAVNQAFGPKCGAFLDVHTKDDVEHLDKALGVLQRVPEPLARLVEQNLRQTTFAYIEVLSDIRRNLDGAPRVLQF
jgi:hypothetical protein